MSWATTLASRPSGTPAASTTCHSWLMSSGVAVKVFMIVSCPGTVVELGQTETDSQDTRRGGVRSRARIELHEHLPLLHRFTRSDADGPHDGRPRGAQLVLHLLGLEHHDPGSGGHRLPRLDLDAYH